MLYAVFVEEFVKLWLDFFCRMLHHGAILLYYVNRVKTYLDLSTMISTLHCRIGHILVLGRRAMTDLERAIHRTRMREYYQRNKEKFKKYKESRRAEHAAYMQVYYAQQDIMEIRARWVLGKAVKDGRVAKPSHCEKCGAAARLHGHHYNGYAEEDRLNVEWLCPACHGEAHRGRLYRSRKDPVAAERICA